MIVQSRNSVSQSSEERLWNARVDLAAALRFAHKLGLGEGVGNHFSAVAPDDPDLYLLNPRGFHWSEVRASDVLVVNQDGDVVEGKHRVEPTAFHIHSRIHRSRPWAKCVLHTHMPYATALCCAQGGRLEWCSQNALRFFGKVAYDHDYSGVALCNEEGDRLAALLKEGISVLFLAAHGIIVSGSSIAIALDDLFYLERACMHQVLAQSTGLPVLHIADSIGEKVIEQMKLVAEESDLHFSAIKRMLDREQPDYSE